MTQMMNTWNDPSYSTQEVHLIAMMDYKRIKIFRSSLFVSATPVTNCLLHSRDNNDKCGLCEHQYYLRPSPDYDCINLLPDTNEYVDDAPSI